MLFPLSMLIKSIFNWLVLLSVCPNRFLRLALQSFYSAKMHQNAPFSGKNLKNVPGHSPLPKSHRHWPHPSRRRSLGACGASMPRLRRGPRRMGCRLRCLSLDPLQILPIYTMGKGRGMSKGGIDAPDSHCFLCFFVDTITHEPLHLA